jgi:hypothetical protein
VNTPTSTHTARYLLAVLALGSFGLQTVSPPAAETEASAPRQAETSGAPNITPHITEKDEELAIAPGIYGADAELEALIETAMERYHTAGLTLPALRIHVHDTSDGCNGASGLYSQLPPVDRIDLCTRLQATVLHELAHAWEHHTMSEDTRQTFLEHTGIEAWQSYGDVDWEDRGIEQAAQIIAWGLMDIQITNTDRFLDELYQFELLTGTPSPRLPNRDHRPAPHLENPKGMRR